MVNLPETPQWEDGIYQIEVSDPVLGGPDGITNRPLKQLASRTSYLKQQVEKGGSDLEKHIAASDPHTQYAPKANPTFTGTPTAPTPANNDNSKKLATTEFVVKALAALAGTAPEALDTLKELADALGNDPNFATTVLNKLAEKLDKDQNGADIPDSALFVKNLGLSNGGYVGRLLSSPKVFISSGTFTPTPGAKRIRITMTGGGGGGGGCQASANNETYFGAGGGAGATVISMFTLTGAANYPLLIGSGGNGGVAAANGSNGGTTSFSTIFSAPGGEGGGKSGFSNTNGGAGGVPTNGDIRLIGGYGGDGQSGLIAVTGQGGVSYFGGGGRAGVGSGVNGSSPGSGGGGSYDSVYSGIAMKGGTGASGIIIIEEFA